MSETTSWTDHVLAGASWRRFGFMLLFAPLLGCVGFLIACIALFQFFSVLASGENNAQLRGLGRDLSRLAVAIMNYLTYNTEQKPFPFGAAPRADAVRETTAAAVAGANSETVAQESARSTRRPAARRKRKATPRKTTPRRRSATTTRKPDSPPPPETDQPSNESGDGEEGDRPE
ncbi:MAG: DUF4389 domain-containing protein [Gammaproteobacteria bacterium]